MVEERYVQGLAQLSKRLRELPRLVASKHLRRAVTSGAAVIRDEARQTGSFHDVTGGLRRAIIMKYIPERSSDQQKTVFVTVRKGQHTQRHEAMRRSEGFVGPGQAVKDKTDAYYWFFLEFGTSRMSAKPFMRPAFKAKQDAALKAIIERLEKGIAAEVKA